MPTKNNNKSRSNNNNDNSSGNRDSEDENKNGSALAIPSSGFPSTYNSIFQEFMKPFDEFMAPFFSGSSTSSLWSELGKKQPNIEFQDRGDHFRLTAELPGFDKKDVEVRVGSSGIELKAEKKSEKKNKTSTQQSYSYFHRYLSLPEQVVSEKIDGTMKNGILELKLPKKEPKPRDDSRRVHLN